MKLHHFLILCITIVLFSCNGQIPLDTVKKDSTEAIVFTGDTVQELSGNIMLIYQHKKNNYYWFASSTSGVYCYNGKTIIHYTVKHGLPDNNVCEIKEDNSGNLYFNTQKGICRYDGDRLVKLEETNGTDKNWELTPNDLWFKAADYSGDIYRYDGQNLFRLKLPGTPFGDDYMAKYPTRPNPYGVYTTYRDSKGNIWFGTAVMGVCRFDGRKIDWISEEDVTEFHNGPSNGVRSVMQDRNGYFWFNTAYKYDVYPKNKGRTNSFYTRERGIGSLENRTTGNITEYLSAVKDDKNNLWFATYNQGVWKYNGIYQEHYSIQNEDKDITVFSIYSDNNGSLWLGTHENGVYRFNGKSFEKFVP